MNTRYAHKLGWHAADMSDFEFKLVVRGKPIVLKNSREIIQVGKGARKRPILIPSSAAKVYIIESVEQLRAQWVPVFSNPIPLNVQLNAAIRSYLPTRSRTDASNLYEAPQDAMKACHARCKPRCFVHAGVIVDDFQIRTHDGSDRLYDPENPRVEITLTPYRGAGDRGQPELPGVTTTRLEPNEDLDF